MKIVIAEDDVVSSERLRHTLIRYGHEAVVYSNGAEAWEALQRPDNEARVVISDWMMPDMDGLELCRAIRTRKEADYIYFILVTALRTENFDFDEAVAAGVDDFLIKPIDPDSIWRRLYVAERILGFTTRIRQLQDLIPICMYCKKIRNDHDYWENIEHFIHEETGSDFSHGICPDCLERHSFSDL